jgi:PAS domain S-box-containing protein
LGVDERSRWAEELASVNARLHASENLLRAVVASTADCVFVKDLEGRYLMINAAGAAMVDRTVEEIVGKKDLDIFTPETAAHLSQRDRQILSTQQTLSYEESLTSGGVTRIYHTTKGPLRDPHNRLIGVIGVAQDNTERAKLLARERSARHEAEEANRSRDEFLASVSHELRTPLSPILFYTGVLRSGQCDATTQARALEVIERCVRAEMRLIDDLLDLERIRGGKLSLKKTAVWLTSVVEDAVAIMRPEANDKAIAVEVTLSAIDQVAGDEQRLRQALCNLLGNAIKFTPRGGRIHVELQREGEQAQVSITDNGEGISPAVLPHLFERCLQSDRHRSNPSGGLGLGLTIVREIVELHGGTARAESAGIGRGATFRINLPPARPLIVNQEQVGGPGLDAARQLAGIRVLLVDDDAATRDALALALEQYGARVDAVATARAALDALEPPAHYDILISDIAMPNEDGCWLMEQVRARSEPGVRMKAIALTASASTEARARTSAAGFHLHLVKPLDVVEIAAAIHQPLVPGLPAAQANSPLQRGSARQSL